MNIKFLDLKAINARYANEIKQEVSNVIDSGYYIGGPVCKKFEELFAKYNDAKYCIGTGNGLDSIRIILEAYKTLGKLKSGDRVIVPSNTFIATALAVTQAGLVPVLVDSCNDYVISVQEIKKVIKTDIKCIIAVNLYGQRCNYEELIKLCSDNGILLIEDSAQSHGALYNGEKKVFGNAAAFSFYPGKNLGAIGDAGCIVTDDFFLAEACRIYCNYGSREKYVHDIQGINSRLDPIQAAILSVKLKYLDQEISARRNIANEYFKGINNSYIALPNYKNINESAYHLFVLRTVYRDELQEYLKQKGIETLIHYPIAISDQKSYKDIEISNSTNSRRLSAECLSIPIGSHLTYMDVGYIIDVINSFMEHSLA